MDKFDSMTNGSILNNEISFSNSLSITAFAANASESETPIQIECSEDACVIMMTFILECYKVSNNRLENPGIPTIPFP
jgi:hypothetical protein